jgi:hypothetical protein
VENVTAIWSTVHGKKKRLLSDDVILLHDNERSHFASATTEAIRQLTKVDLLPRPLSSIHSGTGTMRLLHVCRYKKKHCVYDDESVMKKRCRGVRTWLRSQAKTFLADGIRRLPNPYTIKVKNEKFALEQATKAQRGRCRI